MRTATGLMKTFLLILLVAVIAASILIDGGPAAMLSGLESMAKRAMLWSNRVLSDFG